VQQDLRSRTGEISYGAVRENTGGNDTVPSSVWHAQYASLTH